MALVRLCRGIFYWPPHTTILFCSIFLDKFVLDTPKSRYHRSAPVGYADTEMKRAAIQKADTVRRERPVPDEIWADNEEMILKLSGLI